MQITQPCTLDAIQTVLDVLGVIPGFGTPFDLANAAISIARGNHTDAAMRLLFALPGIGDAAGAAHLASRATHLAEEGAEHFGDDAVRALERACGANSFSADTLVATPDGEQPISTLQVGNLVLAYNQETGTTGAYTVTAVLVNDDPAQLHLTIDGETLNTTPEHPFYTLLRGWVAATALRVGDQVQREDGSYGAVEAVRLDPTSRRMYNLTVEGAHTFFVGEQRWLVHNARIGTCEPYEVGEYSDLYKRSKNTGLDIHHLPQKHPAAQVIPGYNQKTAPAIALPRSEHNLLNNLRGRYNDTAEELIDRQIAQLRDYTDAPESAIQQLINLIYKKYPGVYP